MKKAKKKSPKSKKKKINFPQFDFIKFPIPTKKIRNNFLSKIFKKIFMNKNSIFSIESPYPRMIVSNNENKIKFAEF